MSLPARVETRLRKALIRIDGPLPEVSRVGKRLWLRQKMVTKG
jgi:hypothetical protein